jgi:hypothetical protein
MQSDLFSAKNMAPSVVLPPPPTLQPFFDWPYPGLSPEDSARAALALSSEYADVIAGVVKQHAGDGLTTGQVLALIPTEWKSVLGRWAHANLSATQGQQRGLDVKYVGHDGGSGFHFEYRALSDACR